MKNLKFLVALGIGALLAGGGVAASVFSVNQNVKPVQAATYGGSLRVWISSDNSNPISKSGGVPKLWFHTGSGNDDGTKGSDVYVTGTYGSWNNGAESNRTYYYFDCPTTIINSYLTIQRFASDGTTFWNQSNTIRYTSAVANTVVYLWGNQSTLSNGSIGSVDAGMAAKALEGLMTCSDSSLNGYNAITTLESTFIKNGDNWKTVGNLGDYNISDYADGADWTKSSTARSTQVNAYDKYLALLSKRDGSSSSRFVDFSVKDETVAIATAVAIGGATLGGFGILLKKKKFIFK